MKIDLVRRASQVKNVALQPAKSVIKLARTNSGSDMDDSSLDVDEDEFDDHFSDMEMRAPPKRIVPQRGLQQAWSCAAFGEIIDSSSDEEDNDDDDGVHTAPPTMQRRQSEPAILASGFSKKKKSKNLFADPPAEKASLDSIFGTSTHSRASSCDSSITEKDESESKKSKKKKERRKSSKLGLQLEALKEPSNASTLSASIHSKQSASIKEKREEEPPKEILEELKDEPKKSLDKGSSHSRASTGTKKSKKVKRRKSVESVGSASTHSEKTSKSKSGKKSKDKSKDKDKDKSKNKDKSKDKDKDKSKNEEKESCKEGNLVAQMEALNEKSSRRKSLGGGSVRSKKSTGTSKSRRKKKDKDDSSVRSGKKKKSSKDKDDGSVKSSLRRGTKKDHAKQELTEAEKKQKEMLKYLADEDDGPSTGKEAVPDDTTSSTADETVSVQPPCVSVVQTESKTVETVASKPPLLVAMKRAGLLSKKPDEAASEATATTTTTPVDAKPTDRAAATATVDKPAESTEPAAKPAGLGGLSKLGSKWDRLRSTARFVGKAQVNSKFAGLWGAEDDAAGPAAASAQDGDVYIEGDGNAPQQAATTRPAVDASVVDARLAAIEEMERMIREEREKMEKEKEAIAFERECIELQLEEELHRNEELQKQLEQSRIENNAHEEEGSLGNRTMDDETVLELSGENAALKARLQVEKREAEVMARQLESEIDELKEAVAKMKETEAAIEETPLMPRMSVGRLHGELLQANSKISDKECMIANQKKLIGELTEELCGYREGLGTSKLKEEIADLKSRGTKREAEIDQERTDLEQKVKHKDETIAFLIEEIGKLKQQVTKEESEAKSAFTFRRGGLRR